MVTLADVARAANVSTMTASNALRGKDNVAPPTRDRVLRAASELGYRVNVLAKGLRSGRTGVIALAVPELDMPFPAHFAAEVTTAAARQGVRVVVQQTQSRPEVERTILHDLPGSIVDGVIMCALGLDIHEVEQEIQHSKVVLFDEHITDTMLDIVCSPNEAGAAAACQHLIDRGCRRILILGTREGVDEPHVSPMTADTRWLGALGAVTANPHVEGIPLPCDWNSLDARRAVVDAIDAGIEFDGVFAMTDSVALGALRGLADRSVNCPREVKVMGFDGVLEGQLSVPSLSTIDLGVSALAASAVGMLMQRIENPDDPTPGRREVAEFTLVKRESTAPSAP